MPPQDVERARRKSPHGVMFHLLICWLALLACAGAIARQRTAHCSAIAGRWLTRWHVERRQLPPWSSVEVINAVGDTLCRADTGSGVGVSVVSDASGSSSSGGGSTAPADEPMVYRFFSMTKPVVTVCLLRLWERGVLDGIGGLDAQLCDVLGREWCKDRLTVWQNGVIVPAAREITLRQLLTHTSGLSYGDDTGHPVDRAHAAADLLYPHYGGRDLTQYVSALAAVPLRFQPGTGWFYSASTDVLGRAVEVLAMREAEGKGCKKAEKHEEEQAAEERCQERGLDELLQREVLMPLGMRDSGFWLTDAAKRRRLVPLHEVRARKDNVTRTLYQLAADDKHLPTASAPRLISGGAGLLSTLPDFSLFARMLLGNGTLWSREAGREQVVATLLRPATVAMMVSNQLPAGVDIATMCGSGGCAGFSEAATERVGFGLGVSVQLANTMPTACMASAAAEMGDYGWGGWASTWFQVSPRRNLTLLMVASLIPSDAYPLREEFQHLVYSSLDNSRGK